MNTPKFLFVNVLLVACLTSVATDIYAPSLPIIASLLKAPIEQVQFSLTIFMASLAFSQLFYGPISEGIGRRIPLITGLFIFICGSIMCMLATRVEMLIIGRIIQGLGAGACSALWRSVFRDVYQGDELAKYGSWLSIAITFFIPAIPILGGYLQKYIGWQASFAFLILYCIVALLLIIYVFKETSLHHHKDRLNASFIIKAFKQLLTSRIFMGYTLTVFFCYGAFFSWFAVGPVLLIKHLGLSSVQFGWVSFIIGAGAMALAGTLNGRLVTRFGGRFMMRFGFATMFLAGLLLIAGLNLFGVNLIAILLPVFLFYFGVTFIWPNAFAGAFTPFGTIAGYAGALYSFMQLGGGALIGSLTSFLPASSPLPLAILFLLSPICAWLTYEILVNHASIKVSRSE